MTVSTSNSTVEQVLESPSFPNLLNLIMFENTTTSAQPPYSATCLDCDVCLGSELLCGCQFEFSDNGSCKSGKYGFVDCLAAIHKGCLQNFAEFSPSQCPQILASPWPTASLANCLFGDLYSFTCDPWLISLFYYKMRNWYLLS